MHVPHAHAHVHVHARLYAHALTLPLPRPPGPYQCLQLILERDVLLAELIDLAHVAVRGRQLVA